MPAAAELLILRYLPADLATPEIVRELFLPKHAVNRSSI